MKRVEVEQEIIEKLKEIRELLRKYAPDDVWLSCGISEDHIGINNHYWEHPGEQELNAWEGSWYGFYSCDYDGGGNDAEDTAG